jgi:hypothetical protein
MGLFFYGLSAPFPILLQLSSQLATYACCF